MPDFSCLWLPPAKLNEWKYRAATDKVPPFTTTRVKTRMPKPRTPLLTVDVVIELPAEPGKIVLIERAHAPFGWALPGGFVDVGETVEHAAVREAREETGLDATLIGLLGVYSDPARDPRGHTVSVTFVATAKGLPRGGDDAAHAAAFDPHRPPALAFDHARIVADYLCWRAGRPRSLPVSSTTGDS